MPERGNGRNEPDAGDRTDPDHGVLLAEGREAEVFLQPDGRVLKLLREPSYEPRARREASALRALRTDGQRAPEVHAEVTVNGRPGLVLERVDGTDLLTLLGRRPWLVVRVATVMTDLQVGMHACVAPPELPDLHDELRLQIDSAEALPDQLRGPVVSLLDELPRGDRLCHGDLHPGNILGLQRPVPIDWGASARGAPEADVARTILLHRFSQLPPGSSAAQVALATVGRYAIIATYLRTYRRRAGLDRSLVNRWLAVRAAARLAEATPDEHPRLRHFLARRTLG